MGSHVCTCPGGPEHENWGACIRSKNLRIGYARSTSGLDRTKEKAHQRELDAYADARRQGVQPAGTKLHQVERALEISDRTGEAYGASG